MIEITALPYNCRFLFALPFSPLGCMNRSRICQGTQLTQQCVNEWRAAGVAWVDSQWQLLRQRIVFAWSTNMPSLGNHCPQRTLRTETSGRGFFRWLTKSDANQNQMRAGQPLVGPIQAPAVPPLVLVRSYQRAPLAQAHQDKPNNTQHGNPARSKGRL